MLKTTIDKKFLNETLLIINAKLCMNDFKNNT